MDGLRWIDPSKLVNLQSIMDAEVLIYGRMYHGCLNCGWYVCVIVCDCVCFAALLGMIAGAVKELLASHGAKSNPQCGMAKTFRAPAWVAVVCEDSLEVRCQPVQFAGHAEPCGKNRPPKVRLWVL